MKLVDDEKPFTIDPRVLDRPMYRLDEDCNMAGDRKPRLPPLDRHPDVYSEFAGGRELSAVPGSLNLVANNDPDLDELYGLQVPSISPLHNNNYETMVII